MTTQDVPMKIISPTERMKCGMTKNRGSRPLQTLGLFKRSGCDFCTEERFRRTLRTCRPTLTTKTCFLGDESGFNQRQQTFMCSIFSNSITIVSRKSFHSIKKIFCSKFELNILVQNVLSPNRQSPGNIYSKMKISICYLFMVSVFTFLELKIK